MGLVHIEYVTEPTADLAIRVVDYRVRLRRRHPDTPLLQIVLVLRDRRVPDRHDDIDAGTLIATWTVVRLIDLDPTALLATPTTAALAALAGHDEGERAALLSTAATAIAAGASRERARLLIEVAATLASLVLPDPTIDTAIKEATMPRDGPTCPTRSGSRGWPASPISATPEP